MKIIDPHLHLFDLSKGKYHWLKPNNPPNWPDKALINKNFDELSIKLDKPLALAGFVHIEAGFDNENPEKEIDWLESTIVSPFKSIACIDLTASTIQFRETLKRLKQRKSVIGVRHILDDNAQEILSDNNTSKNLTALAEQQLLFECQISFYDTRAVNTLVQLLRNLPTLTVIINHAGFVDTSTNDTWQLWHNSLELLSQLPKLAIKCSGWEMTDRHYQAQTILKTTQACIEVMSKDRVMMASNFPLCLFNCSYQGYWQSVYHLLPEIQRSSLCYENAKNWYKLV
ncbi:amidohydrolase family protein [Thalassotalea marina]|uniref:Amidohydrolase n=1 Tax=Thalassotalea marina TaxID=1673741 RepID=A0A919BBX6_9GAMM|nr:amidohydrolase family protein [Thalassotalea marina]GHF81557.1 amidohydrolase [Thalassotalea marina]